MKVVLDTNVLVSGLLNPSGSPGRVLDLVMAAEVTLLYDDRILAEYREVLLRPRFGFDPSDVEALLDFLVSEGEQVVSAPLPIILPDPDDLPFLEVAVAGLVSALVTGNGQHFIPVSPSPSGAEGVRVCAPADLIALWQAHGAR